MNDIEREAGEPRAQQEGLYAPPEVIFDEKRSIESLVGAEIPAELLDDMEEMLDDLTTISSSIFPDEQKRERISKAVDGIKKADESWQEIISEGGEEGQATQELEIKDRIRRVVFGIGGILERTKERENLHTKYRAARGEEARAIEERVSEINSEDVSWQQDVIIFTLSLARNPRGRDVLGRFWTSFESLHHRLDPRVASSRSEMTLGQQEARNIHNSIAGMLGTMLVLNRMGYDPYLPDPQQDAKGKVDLWVKPKGASWQEGILGLQLKTSINGIRGLEARKIDDHFFDVIERIGTKKDKRAAEKLHQFLQQYSQNYHTPSAGIWVDLTGAREEEVVDSITGEPHFEGMQIESLHRILDEQFREQQPKRRAA